MSEWIDASDLLPDTDDLVLACTEYDQIIVGFFDGEHWCSGNYTVSWDLAFNHDISIKSWMPLPQPPKN